MQARAERTVVLTASPGGHLALLRATAHAMDDVRRVWAVAPGPGAASLRAAGEAVFEIPLFRRAPAHTLRAVRRSLGLLIRIRPAVVVTSGASDVLPLVVGARALGIPVVYVETMARVRAFSRTGDLIRRFATDVAVQWPELLVHAPDARLCRPALLEDVPATAAPVGSRQGTLVAVGTHDQPFDRLLELVDDAVGQGLLPLPVVAQTGHCTYQPRHFEATKWLSGEQMDAAMRTSRIVVCHGGAGIVASAVRAGLRPLVGARRADLDEHVDDHQEEIVAKLRELGYVREVLGPLSAADVASLDAPWPAPRFDGLPSVSAYLREATRE